jgi:5,5'-dehydrodivanillate O-demethylase oxygenase subunit
MLTERENELLTRVGPGTPMGDLLRRYWHPIGSVTEMDGRWTKRVRILGEDLVLFKTRAGAFGLIAELCPHRRASLFYGIPQADGIRCPYHGWKFDARGTCLEQPNEPEGSTFKDKTATTGYPVAERGGLLWAYLGPLPAPVVPPLPNLDAPGKIRMLGHAVIPCNWLQIMENSLDAVHTEWLHGHLPAFVQEKAGFTTNFTRKHLKIGFDEFAHGIIKRRVVEGFTEDDDDWKVGHPVVFPTTLLVGSHSGHMRYQFRVPIDDTHTMHYWYHVITPPAGAEVPAALLEDVDTYEVPYLDERGEYPLQLIHVQDIMAWITQGPIADRTVEALGVTDRGITLFRKMLQAQLKLAQSGADPMNVFRDPAQPELELPLEEVRMQNDGIRERAVITMFERHDASFAHVREEVVKLFRDALQPVPSLA